MLVLLIVDDEKTTRESLRDFIPWEGLGVGRVETARNGLAALEIAERIPPDIVLTDIRMPKMDGIELAGRLRAMSPDCKIIFISGFSDKEYLKSAIHLRAVSYIEKPLNADEIKTVVSEAVRSCGEEERRRTDDAKLRDSLAESRPLIRQEIALELVRGNADIPRLLGKYRDPLFEAPRDGFFMAACAAINWSVETGGYEKADAKQRVLDLFCRGGPGCRFLCAAGFAEDERLAVVCAGGADALAPTAPEDMLERLNVLSCGRFTASVGMGTSVRGVEGIPASFRAASDAVRMQFYGGCGKVYRRGPKAVPPPSPAFDPAREFREALRAGGADAASGLVRGFTESVRASESADIEGVKNAYFGLLLAVHEAAGERNIAGRADGNEKSYIWQEIDRMRFLSDLSGYVLSNISAVAARDEGDLAGRKAAEIMKYIRDHISDRKLSVLSVSRSCNLSQAYLCSFFKKTTGKTLNDYATGVRMEKARELLKDSRIKLYEVALGVGLTDPNYFSTLFKKYEGCTPSEYREKFAR